MILEILTTIVGTAMSLAYFPQAYRIWKNKSSKNISVLTFFIFSLGTLLWTIYGIYVKSWVIIISFIPGVVGSWTILLLTIYYRNRKH